METVNHEYYVSREVAKLLEEAGFDWECWGNYSPKGTFQQIVFEWKPVVENWNNTPNAKNCTSAPTLEVAQRWLREVKNISVEIERYETPNPVARELFEAVYEKTVEKSFAYAVNVIDVNNESIYDEDCFLTYEEAQEAGIEKALEIILKKGE